MSGKKAQTAIELITVYGWVVLLILVIVMIAYYSGYLDVRNLFPVYCNIAPTMSCRTFRFGYAPDGKSMVLVYRIVNGLGYDILLPDSSVSLYVENIGKSGKKEYRGNCYPTAYPIKPGTVLSCLVFIPDMEIVPGIGKNLDFRLAIRYRNCNALQNYTKTGSCTGAPEYTVSGAIRTQMEPPSATLYACGDEACDYMLGENPTNCCDDCPVEYLNLTADPNPVNTSMFTTLTATAQYADTSFAVGANVTFDKVGGLSDMDYLDPNSSITNATGNAVSTYGSLVDGNMTLRARTCGPKATAIVVVNVGIAPPNGTILFSWYPSQVAAGSYYNITINVSNSSGAPAQFQTVRLTADAYSLVSPPQVTTDANGIAYVNFSSNIIHVGRLTARALGMWNSTNLVFTPPEGSLILSTSGPADVSSEGKIGIYGCLYNTNGTPISNVNVSLVAECNGCYFWSDTGQSKLNFTYFQTAFPTLLSHIPPEVGYEVFGYNSEYDVADPIELDAYAGKFVRIFMRGDGHEEDRADLIAQYLSYKGIDGKGERKIYLFYNATDVAPLELDPTAFYNYLTEDLDSREINYTNISNPMDLKNLMLFHARESVIISLHEFLPVEVWACNDINDPNNVPKKFFERGGIEIHSGDWEFYWALDPSETNPTHPGLKLCSESGIYNIFDWSTTNWYDRPLDDQVYAVKTNKTTTATTYTSENGCFNQNTAHPSLYATIPMNVTIKANYSSIFNSTTANFVPRKCEDGTESGNCSATQPKFCIQGYLTDRCGPPENCGCPDPSQICDTSGICVEGPKTILLDVRTFHQGQCLLSTPTNPPLNPVGYWKFDEGAGSTAHDSSGNGNDGTLYNNPTWVTGEVGGALQFDGVSTYAEAPDSSSLDVTNAVTLEAWVYPNSLTGWTNVIEKDQEGGYKLGFYNNQVVFTLYQLLDESSTGTVPLNQWSYVAATYDGQNVKIYINGNLDTTIAHTEEIGVGESPVDIGWRRTSSASYFNGVMDEVKVWNRALTAEEINAEYAAVYEQGATPCSLPNDGFTNLEVIARVIGTYGTQLKDVQVNWDTRNLLIRSILCQTTDNNCGSYDTIGPPSDPRAVAYVTSNGSWTGIANVTAKVMIGGVAVLNKSINITVTDSKIVGRVMWVLENGVDNLPADNYTKTHMCVILFGINESALGQVRTCFNTSFGTFDNNLSTQCPLNTNEYGGACVKLKSPISGYPTVSANITNGSSYINSVSPLSIRFYELPSSILINFPNPTRPCADCSGSSITINATFKNSTGGIISGIPYVYFYQPDQLVYYWGGPYGPVYTWQWYDWQFLRPSYLPPGVQSWSDDYCEYRSMTDGVCSTSTSSSGSAYTTFGPVYPPGTYKIHVSTWYNCDAAPFSPENCHSSVSNTKLMSITPVQKTIILSLPKTVIKPDLTDSIDATFTIYGTDKSKLSNIYYNGSITPCPDPDNNCPSYDTGWTWSSRYTNSSGQGYMADIKHDISGLFNLSIFTYYYNDSISDWVKVSNSTMITFGPVIKSIQVNASPQTAYADGIYKLYITVTVKDSTGAPMDNLWININTPKDLSGNPVGNLGCCSTPGCDCWHMHTDSNGQFTTALVSSVVGDVNASAFAYYSDGTNLLQLSNYTNVTFKDPPANAQITSNTSNISDDGVDRALIMTRFTDSSGNPTPGIPVNCNVSENAVFFPTANLITDTGGMVYTNLSAISNPATIMCYYTGQTTVLNSKDITVNRVTQTGPYNISLSSTQTTAAAGSYILVNATVINQVTRLPVPTVRVDFTTSYGGSLQNSWSMTDSGGSAYANVTAIGPGNIFVKANASGNFDVMKLGYT
jgi:hypothetical protein